MSQRVDFEGSSDIGAYAILTNKYCVVGKSSSRNFYSYFQEHLHISLVETTINSIKTVGSLCVGNKNGLLVPSTATDQELLHLRNLLPENVRIKRIGERLNALGNVIVCNDSVALVHGDIDDESVKNIEEVLMVDVFRHNIGCEPLVGTFSAMNNQGMLVHPRTSVEEIDELCNLLSVSVVAGTINKGSSVIGGGMVVNDWISFMGHRSTATEVTVIENAFKLVDGRDDENLKKVWVESMVN